MPRKKKISYADKLLDPRWQKKRLEIFERDKWTCQDCGDATQTLNAHHFWYDLERDPWDYPDSNFITLCWACHKYDKDYRYSMEKELIQALKLERFLVKDIMDLIDNIRNNGKQK